MVTSIDTLEIAKRLRSAGFDDPQAEAITGALRDVHDADLSRLATKEDIAGLRSEIAAVRSDAFAALPRAEHRWLLTCFNRYCNRAGEAFPSLRQLARDARMSLASVSRYMTDLERLGVFQRQRKPGGRYRYVLAEAYRPRWPGRVPALGQRVSQAETQKANPSKQIESGRFAGLSDDRHQWEARLRSWRNTGGRFWNDFWGPRPDQPNCWAPRELLAVNGVR